MAIGLAAASSRPPYSAGEVREAIRDVARRADAGDAEALYQFARLYENGYDSIPRDSLKALNLYKMAADANYLPALNYLGYFLITNSNYDADAASEGLQLLEKAAFQGDAKAQSNIGYLLITGNNVIRDYEKGAFWLERAAQQGVAQASSMLGDLYRNGLGVAQDSLQAAAHYYAALDAGLADAAYKLEALDSVRWKTLPAAEQLQRAGYFYTHRAPDVAIAILNRVVSSGVPADNDSIRGEAFLMLADAYALGRGVKYNHDKSIEYYKQAASLNNAEAKRVLQELLEIFPDALNP